MSADGFLEPKQRVAGPSYIDPYLPYLLKRWDEGCHKVVQLWREICAQGYEHGRGMIYSYVERLKQGERPLCMAATIEAPSPAREECYAPREAVWLLLRRPDELNARELTDLAAMQKSCPPIALAYRLGQSFVAMLRERQVAQLAPWLEEASSSGLPELRSLANGIGRDRAAVVAGLTLPWSSGQVEGQVNRLKLVKRQMYGRAKLDLLRQRVLQRV